MEHRHEQWLANVKTSETRSRDVRAYRDEATGLAYVIDWRGPVPCRHTCHPNLKEHGSLTGAGPTEWWGKDARFVRFEGFLYNIGENVQNDHLDAVAARFCECAGCLARKAKPNQDALALIKLLQKAKETTDLMLAGQASIADVAACAGDLEKWLWGIEFLEEIKEYPSAGVRIE